MRKPKRIENGRDAAFHFTRQRLVPKGDGDIRYLFQLWDSRRAGDLCEAAQVWVVNTRVDDRASGNWCVETEGLPRFSDDRTAAAISRLIQLASSWCRRLINIDERKERANGAES